MIHTGIRSVKFFLVILIFFTLVSSIFSQQVVLNINSIEENEKGFLVKGFVVMSNMNPGGQIVEEDGCSIIVDIKSGSDSVYPVLPDALKIRTPKNVETSYLKGKNYLTKKEYYGENIGRLVLAGISPRGNNIWRRYGGLGVWRKKAPNCVTREFEAVIPKIYAGKTVRIRATLRHQWGGPYAPWSAYSFFHHIGHEGVLKKNNIKEPHSHKVYLTSGPAGSPNPAGKGGSVQCRISAKDTQGHNLLYQWTVNPQAGSFSDPTISNPVWTPPVNSMDKMRSYTISCTVTCSADSSIKVTGLFIQEICPEIKPVSIILRISAEGFETYKKETKTFMPRYKRLTFHGPVNQMTRNNVGAGLIGEDAKVFAKLIVMCEGKEVRTRRALCKKSYYDLTVDLSEFAGCIKKEKIVRWKQIYLKQIESTDNNKEKNKKQKSKNMYEKILSEKFGEKKGFKKIWALMGLYKAYQNDKVHMATGKTDTPNLNKFIKNMKKGPVGEMKNAVNTLWEFAKDPLTLGGSAIEDMIQNTNKLLENTIGKGFLKKVKNGENSIKDAGIALKNKLEDLRKVLEAK